MRVPSFVILSGMGLLVFAARNSPTQEVKKSDADSKAIQGTWSRVYEEHLGERFSSVAMEKELADTLQPPRMNIPTDPYSPYLWKISGHALEAGRSKALFSPARYEIVLNPNGKPGEIDLIPLDKEERKNEKEKLTGIYFVRDDLLTVCLGTDGNRPSRFTSTKTPPTWLTIFRRGNLK